MEKKKKVNNPQDKLMRTMLLDREEAAEFINKVLGFKGKERLIPEELKNYTTTFVNKRLENRTSDVVYKIESKEKVEGEVYTIIEHQSKVDHSMPIRTLEYKNEILRLAIDRKKSKKANYKKPSVITITAYTGKGRWTVKDIEYNKSRLNGKTDTEYGEIVVECLKEYNKKEALESKTMMPKIFLIQNQDKIEELIDTYNEIIEKPLSKEQKNMLVLFMRNMIEEALGEKQTEELIEKIKIKEEGSQMMAVSRMIRKEIRDTWKSGVEKGIEQGIIRGEKSGIEKGEKTGIKKGEKTGREKAKVEMAKLMLMEKADIEFIKRVTGLSKKEILALQ